MRRPASVRSRSAVSRATVTVISEEILCGCRRMYGRWAVIIHIGDGLAGDRHRAPGATIGQRNRLRHRVPRAIEMRQILLVKRGRALKGCAIRCADLENIPDAPCVETRRSSHPSNRTQAGRCAGRAPGFPARRLWRPLHRRTSRSAHGASTHTARSPRTCQHNNAAQQRDHQSCADRFHCVVPAIIYPMPRRV